VPSCPRCSSFFARGRRSTRLLLILLNWSPCGGLLLRRDVVHMPSAYCFPVSLLESNEPSSAPERGGHSHILLLVDFEYDERVDIL
jgi:hypothetical protein